MLAALAAEVTESLGVDRYQRGQQARLGYRNDHGELHVSTTAGPVALERPRLRGTTEPFASRLLGKGRQPRRCAGVAGAVGVRAWLARPGEAPADGHRWAMYRS